MSGAWPAGYDAKPSAAVLDYAYDFGPEIAANEPTDAVESVSLSMAPADGAIGANTIGVTPAGLVTFWLQGGRPGTIYHLNIAVATAGGRVIVASPAPRIPVV